VYTLQSVITQEQYPSFYPSNKLPIMTSTLLRNVTINISNQHSAARLAAANTDCEIKCSWR